LNKKRWKEEEAWLAIIFHCAAKLPLWGGGEEEEQAAGLL
jgi:hypothetical protein